MTLFQEAFKTRWNALNLSLFLKGAFLKGFFFCCRLCCILSLMKPIQPNISFLYFHLNLAIKFMGLLVQLEAEVS